jgi:hypothetical protein
MNQINYHVATGAGKTANGISVSSRFFISAFGSILAGIHRKKSRKNVFVLQQKMMS